jgi:hypothetical protein
MRTFPLWLLIAAVAAGAYILGAKAGRSRYAEISHTARRVWDDPAVKKVRTKTYRRIEKAAKRAAKKIGA